MSNKQNLPAGIYANDEYPIYVKQTRNKLRPILRDLRKAFLNLGITVNW